MKRVRKIISLLCLLSVLLTLVIAPLEAQGKRKLRHRKGAAMLTDQEIKDALRDGAIIALVKVESTEVQAPGTRGHQTFYKLKISQCLLGQLSGTVDAQRYGAPVVQKGQEAIVVLDAANDEHRLQAFVLVPDGKQTEVVRAHNERIEKLKASK